MVSRRCLIRKKSIVIVFALFGKKRSQKKEIQGKKSLKIPKGQSVSVFRRRTDNTMAKRKKYKRTTIYKTKDTSKLKKVRQYNDRKKKDIIQIYHVWEGYLRKIPVERRNKFSLKTGIFRKYPSQTWYICLITPNVI